MTKTVLLKFLLAVVITFILILPEYFKTPNGNTLELWCLEVCLQPNLTSSRPLNFSFVTFLPPARETQTALRLFLNHSNFQNFTRICQDISREFKMCSCLVCELKGNVDFIFQEETPKVLVMRGSMEKSNDFHSPCQHFNSTVPPLVDLEDYNISCNLKDYTGLQIEEEESSKKKSPNSTCRITEYPHNCIHISLYLELNVKSIICSMKITWYILVLLVFVALFILIVQKILGELRKTQKLWSHKYNSTSVLLRKSDSEKLRTLNVRVISETTRRLPLTQVKEVLPQIPELEVTSVEFQQCQYTRQVEAVMSHGNKLMKPFETARKCLFSACAKHRTVCNEPKMEEPRVESRKKTLFLTDPHYRSRLNVLISIDELFLFDILLEWVKFFFMHLFTFTDFAFFWN